MSAGLRRRSLVSQPETRLLSMADIIPWAGTILGVDFCYTGLYMEPTKSPKILFVEDEIGYQELAESILSEQYALTVCSSAERAMVKLDAETFDLVIADIYLFGLSGLELLSKLRREGKSESCPVILCSSRVDPEIRQRAMDLGAAGFLAKPYPIETLANLAATFLAR